MSVGRVILESIVTTVDADGRVNIAPMGPTVLSYDPQSGRPRFKMRPWQGSTTCANLLASGNAVIHVTDDARLIARAAIGKVPPDGLVCPVEPADDKSVRHYRLVDCHRWYAVTVDRQADVTSERFSGTKTQTRGMQDGADADGRKVGDATAAAVRHELIAVTVAEGVVRPFFGFNRAKHAVIEAAILATRLHVLPAAEVWRELQRCQVAVDKTAGADEREAMAMLCAFIEQRIGASGGSDPIRQRQKKADRSVIEIQTGARLHFGLLDVRSPFGGCGVMVDWPATTVRVEPFTSFRCSGDHQQRVRRIARRMADRLNQQDLPSVAVDIRSSAPAHSGLGSGTQLSMAIAEGLWRAAAVSGQTGGLKWTESLMVDLADRGHRSAVGAIGYFYGGWVTEGTSGAEIRHGQSVLERLDRRMVVPEAWRVGILLPRAASAVAPSVSGRDEQRRFDSVPDVTPQRREKLASLLWRELMPAVEVGDFSNFGDSLTRYNRLSGELFAAVQGGPYHGESTTRLIDELLQRGHRGVGQSSWGPGVFVWFESSDGAEAFAEAHEADSLSRAWSFHWTLPRMRPRTVVRLSD